MNLNGRAVSAEVLASLDKWTLPKEGLLDLDYIQLVFPSYPQKCSRGHFDRFLRAVSEMLHSRTEATETFSWYPDPTTVPVLNPNSWASLSRLQALPKSVRLVTDWKAVAAEAAVEAEALEATSISSFAGYTRAAVIKREELEAVDEISPGEC
jgi:hypothetical protein